MPLNQKGRKLIKMITEQHGLKFKGLSQSGILHYSLTDRARVQHFKSTLRKYKLHYRAEDTQRAEETGIYTLKIRTEQDHQRLKLRRKYNKVNKKKTKGSKGKGSKGKGGVPGALALVATTVEAKTYDANDVRTELGLSIVDWEELQDANFAQHLTSTLLIF
jgi:hypothetical protein